MEGQSVTLHLAFLDEEVERMESALLEWVKDDERWSQDVELLCSIPGIGESTAMTLLGEMGDGQHFVSAKKMAAYAGVTPQEHESGTSVRRGARMSRKENVRVRKALYFPSVIACKAKSPWAAYVERLRGNGKIGKQVVVAMMHKLLRVIYGVLKTRQPFDLQLAFSSCSP